MSRNIFFGNNSHFDHAMGTLSNTLTIGGSSLNASLAGIQQGICETMSQLTGTYVSKEILEDAEALSNLLEKKRKQRWMAFKDARAAEERLEVKERNQEILERIVAAQEKEEELDKRIKSLQAKLKKNKEQE